MLSTLIKTEYSFLTTQQFPDSELLEKCVEEIQGKLLETPEIKLYGKIMHQHRNIGFFSDDSKGYWYSGQLAASQPLSSSLLLLLQSINTMYHTNCNGILVNQYRNGEDYISAHSDNEHHLDPEGVISISYGATRTFRIRNKETKHIVQDIKMESNQIIHMGGSFQKEFTHEIPMEKRIKEVRYSFTFRKHNE